MTNLFYKGQSIEQRQDGYVNATQMAKANGVLIADWLRLEATEAYKQELASNMGIPIIELSVVKQGSPKNGGGTWLHPLLALNFGRWISPKFAIWCDKHIKTLIETGSTSIKSNSIESGFNYALLAAKEIAEIQQYLPNQPRITQVLIDHTLNLRLEAISSTTKETEIKYRGVAEIAEDMGYKVTLSNRVTLGKFVAQKLRHLIHKEERLCNGQMRKINCYPDNSEVRNAIDDYFLVHQQEA